MDQMIEHLQIPIGVVSEGLSLSPNDIKISNGTFDSHICKENEDLQNLNVVNVKSMYDMIFTTVMPKWRNYLRLKSERSIETQVKPRQDTLWKKIFRDVREFFRILFRLRFHHHEFKNYEGASNWVQRFFDELGIPLFEREAYDSKLFRFVHQTHRLKAWKENELVVSPFEAIEKFNEIYK